MSRSIVNPAAASRRRAWVNVLSGLTLCMSALVLVGGWGAGIVILTRLHPSYSAMAPSTALCIFLGSAVLLLWNNLRFSNDNIPRAVAYGAGATIGIIAFVDLVAIFFAGMKGVDALIWPDVAALQVSGMASATACAFLFFAFSLLRLPRRLAGPDRAYMYAATIGLVMVLIAVVGYAFDAEALYAVSIYTSMALHTALSFVVLFTALLLLRPDSGWIAVLLGDGVGSIGARRLFPAVIIMPFALCLIALAFTETGFVDANFRLSVLAIAMMAALAAVVLCNAVSENRRQEQLLTTNKELAAAVAARDLLLREVYHRVKNNLQMTNALLQIGAQSVQEEAARDVLHSTARRVEALGTVHRLLIAAVIPSELEVPTFLKELCENIVSGCGGKSRGITVETSADQALIHIDKAVTIGLLLNELVTNAVKHAFHGRDGGKISVAYHVQAAGDVQEQGDIILTVSDDGTGIGTDVDEAPSRKGTGNHIIRGLVQQLRATMTVHVDKGTTISIDIPNEALLGGRYVA